MPFDAECASELPREKLLLFGARSLSDAELVAILLRTGRSGENVVSFARRLLKDFGGAEGLSKASAKELMETPGLKEAKAAALAAAFELGKRAVAGKVVPREEWRAALQRKALDAKFLESEYIYAFFLDANERVMEEATLSYGGINGAYLDLPAFLRKAVRHNAAKVAVLHNHPDGSRAASGEDIKLTEYMERALSVLGIEMKGHYIAACGELFPVRGEERLHVGDGC